MKRTGTEGFSLIEVLVSMAILGAVVVPICASLVLSFRINAKTDDMMQAQLAVSSAVETLMAEGIPAGTDSTGDGGDYGRTDDKNDRFPDVLIRVTAVESEPYYNVVVTDNAELVTVETVIRAVGEGGGA